MTDQCWRPNDKHAAALITEAVNDSDDYSHEEMQGLIEDLCSELKRVHGKLEQCEKTSRCNFEMQTNSATEQDQVLFGTSFTYECECGMKHRLPPERVFMQHRPR